MATDVTVSRLCEEFNEFIDALDGVGIKATIGLDELITNFVRVTTEVLEQHPDSELDDDKVTALIDLLHIIKREIVRLNIDFALKFGEVYLS